MEILEERVRKQKRRFLDGQESKFSYIDPQIVLELLEKGVLPKEIAEIYGCTTDTLKYQMRLKGYEYDGRNLIRRSNIGIDDVVKLREEGYTIRRIASIHGIGLKAVINRLRKGGIEPEEKIEVDEGKIYELYKEGLSKAEIQRETGYSLYFVNKALKNVGIEKRKRKKYDIPMGEVINRFKNGEKPYKIAEELGLQLRTVDDFLRKMGFRTPKRPRLYIPINEVFRLYEEEKLTIEQIAYKFNCSTLTIYDRLRERKRNFNGIRKTQTARFNLPKRKIRADFNKGESITKLSIKYNSTIPTIKKIVQDIIDKRNENPQE